jgi:hypothetical protein
LKKSPREKLRKNSVLGKARKKNKKKEKIILTNEVV